MRQLSADEIAAQVRGLEDQIRERVKRELLELLDPKTFTVQPDEPDTFEQGIEAVRLAIESNF